MVALSNNAEGGTNTTTVTTGNSGGESGDAWDSVSFGGSGTITFDNTHPVRTLAYKIVGDTANNSLLRWNTSLGTQTELWGRTYFYLTAFSVNQGFIWLRNGGNQVVRIRVNTSGNVEVLDGSNTIILTSTTVVNLNSYFRIEFHVIALAVNGTIEVRLFNDPNSATPTETVMSTTASLFDDVGDAGFGQLASTPAATFWIDDVQVNTTGFPGPALNVFNQFVDNGDITDIQNTITPTPGNWLIAILTWDYYIAGPDPIFNFADASRNVWNLLFTRTASSSYSNQSLAVVEGIGRVGVQIWACPAVEYDGWPYLYVTASIQQILGVDVGSVCVNIMEVVGMANGHLTVDSVVVQAANNVGSITLTAPTPVGGADCLMIAAAGGNIAYGSYTTTGTGWTQLVNETQTTPELGLFGAWREASTGGSVTFSLVSPAVTYWAGVLASIRVTGTSPAQPNPNWPAVEFQMGYGFNLNSSLAAIPWTDQTVRYWAMNTKRGIQYELGNAQAEPSTVTMRNDDGALSFRPQSIAEATADGTSTTFICSATDAASLSVGDFFQIQNKTLNANPGFESGTTGWTTVGGTLTTVSTPVYDGTLSGRFTPDGTTATVQVKPSTHATVSPNVVYTFSGWIYTQVARRIELRAIWLDNTNTFISNDIITMQLQPTTWTFFSGNFTAPSNAASADVAPTMTGTPPATNVIYLDDISVARSNELSTYQITNVTTSGGTSTVTFMLANGDAGGALNATLTGDFLITTPIDLYTPFRVLMTWEGKRRYVTAGWSERWPLTWRDPHWGTAAMVSTSALAQLTAANYTAVQGEYLRRNPYAYWPLGDAAGSPSALNISGRSLAALVQSTSKNGIGTSTANFGESTQGVDTGPSGFVSLQTLFGDPGNGWRQDFTSGSDISGNRGQALVAQDSGFPSITNGVSIAIITCLTDAEALQIETATTNPTLFICKNTDPGAGVAEGAAIKLDWDYATAGFPAVTVWDQSTHASTRTVCSSAGQLSEDFVLTVLTFNQTAWKVYNFGELAGSGSANLISSFGMLDVFGEADQFFNGKCMTGLVAHVAVFDRVLSAFEVQDMNNAMLGFGNGTEFTANRVQRKLDTIKQKTGRVMDATGQILCDAEGTDATTITDVNNQVAGYEDALVFEDAGGNYQYRPPARYAYQAPKAVLGERTDLGEIPYLASPETDFDPTYLFNSVTDINTITSQFSYKADISQNQLTAVDDTSVTKYNLRTYTRDTRISFARPEQVFNLVYWLLSQYSTPKQRVASVTVDAASNPAIWPFVLDIEVGDLVTFKRRPIGAPEIDIPCVVLQVEHDTGPGLWTTTLTLGAARSAQLLTTDPVFGIVGDNFISPQ